MEIEKIITCLKEEIALITNQPAECIDHDLNFLRIGISSLQTIKVTNKMKKHLGIDIDPIAMFLYETISEFATYLSQCKADQMAKELHPLLGTQLPNASEYESIYQEVINLDDNHASLNNALPSRVITLPVLEIEKALQGKFNQLTERYLNSQVQEGLLLLEKLSYYYILQAFYVFGWQPQVNHSLCLSKFVMRGAIQPQHQKLLVRLFKILQAEGILEPLAALTEKETNTWKVKQLPPAEDELPKLIDQLIEQIETIYPTGTIELGLLNRCGKQLAVVMQGKQAPLPLLFPGHHERISAATLYQEAPYAIVMNQLIKDAFIQAIQSVRKHLSRPLRILEIGAGTGGTTSHILLALRELGIQFHYTFTDIFPLFLEQAKEKFKAYTEISYRLLNIEEDPKSQGFDPQQYDIVLAANVLHATQDIRQSLHHVRHLLIPEGLLTLIEGVKVQRWLDLTFGLLDGWWRFQDNDIRLDHPLLSNEQWQKLLEETGFNETAIVGDHQAVVISRKQ